MVYYLYISGAKIQKVFHIRKREGARMQIIYIMCQFLHIREGECKEGDIEIGVR